jgi:predicted site-specific integrase-resolvase
LVPSACAQCGTTLQPVRSFALSAARQRSDRAMLVGYARVSTQDQNLELQREALTQAGCQKLFEDKLSGTRAERPGLAKALKCYARRHAGRLEAGSPGP